MSDLLPSIYILVLTLLGWVISLLPWPAERKWIAAAVAVLFVPMLFIIPAISQRHGAFADLQVAVGVTALVWGALALGTGWGGSMLLRAWRGRRG